MKGLYLNEKLSRWYLAESCSSPAALMCTQTFKLTHKQLPIISWTDKALVLPHTLSMGLLTANLWIAYQGWSWRLFCTEVSSFNQSDQQVCKEIWFLTKYLIPFFSPQLIKRLNCHSFDFLSLEMWNQQISWGDHHLRMKKIKAKAFMCTSLLILALPLGYAKLAENQYFRLQQVWWHSLLWILQGKTAV